MQRKRNIRLLIILSVLIAVTLVVFLADSTGDRISVNKELFSLADTKEVDQVVMARSSTRDELKFINGKWQINGKYVADRQRIKVLFAVLKQNRIRRKVSKQAIDQVDSLFTTGKIEVSFYNEGQLAKRFEVAGNPDSFITYVRAGADSDTYIVEIPGYRAYLGEVYSLDENGWRDPLVFNMNWTNLKQVSMIYPDDSDKQFDVAFNGRSYSIRQLPKTDSTKLTDFLDGVSLLFVKDYLFPKEVAQFNEELQTTQAAVVISDVGDNMHSVEFFDRVAGKDEILGRIDSADYALFDYQKVRKLLKPRGFFVAKESD